MVLDGTVMAVGPDLLRKHILLNNLKSAVLKKADSPGQGEEGWNLPPESLIEQFCHQQAADSLSLGRIFDGQ
jgi:hypothetical protein